jgi:tetratricopeptide (TPR) repeat protein
VDKLSKELDVVDNFVLTHWKRYATIGIVIVVVLGIILVIYENKHATSVQVSNEVLSASTIPELQKVIEKYPNYASVDFARLSLASKLFDNKKYAEAIKLYNSEIKFSSSKYSAGIGQLNRAYALEAEGKKTEAAKQFKALADNTQIPNIIRCQASYSAGRIFKSLGNTEQAVSMLKKSTADKNICQFWPEMAEKMLNKISL